MTLVLAGQTREERLRDFRMPGDLVPYHYDIDVRPEVLNETGRGFVADSQIEVPHVKIYQIIIRFSC